MPSPDSAIDSKRSTPVQTLLQELAEDVQHELSLWVDERPVPENLRNALRYVVLAGGKRLRPALAMLCAEAVGGRRQDALPAACAIELVHTFSLVHDDLPCMDDDDLRRGRPTLHRHASEDLAVLAGDALLNQAFELLATRIEAPALSRDLVCELSRGTADMISGQVYDTCPDFDESVTEKTRLLTIHRHKTAALLRAACRMGALSGQADTRGLAALTSYAEATGLMFQIVDDLLDVTQTTETLGKRADKDAEKGKLTFPGLMGIETSRAEVERLRVEAHAALAPLEPQHAAGTRPLHELCDWMAIRTR